MSIEIFGDPNGAVRTVEDDHLGTSGPDQYFGAPGDSLFTSVNLWSTCCTDGQAISGLDETWWLHIQFTEIDGNLATPPIAGMTDWRIRGVNGTQLTLVLQPDRRVRLAALPACLDGNVGAAVGGPFDVLRVVPSCAEGRQAHGVYQIGEV